jgi:hypothetical protein
MAMNDSRRDPNETVATQDEITAAINALTRADKKRLESAARFYINGLGRKAVRRDWGDLLRETVMAFYRPDGRKWYKDRVDLMRTLLLNMRSVASNWKEAVSDREAISEAELIFVDDEGRTSFSIEQVAGESPDIQKELERREKLDMARRVIGERDHAVLILDGICEGLKGSEIAELLELSEQEYEKHRIWMLRKLRKAFQRG